MATEQANTELKDDFKVSFEGDQNQVDANTFVNYLIHLNTIIQEVNREVAPERKIRVKIKALEKGSFVVNIELQSVIDQIKLLFDAQSVDYLSGLVTIITGLYGAKEFLKAKKPERVEKQGDSVIIYGENGQSVQISNTTYNIYTTNSTVEQALTKQFETLEQDENIQRVEIRDNKDKALISVPREKFVDLAQPNEIFNGGVQHEVRKVMLSIVKLSFDSRLKSDFVYMGIRITALIKDKYFYELVDKGQSFAKGDALEVRLQVNKVFDTSVNADMIKGYEILEVLRHVPRNDPGQLKLDLTTG